MTLSQMGACVHVGRFAWDRASSDLGKTWEGEQTVAYRGDSRDGMPAVVEHKGIQIVIFESWRNPKKPPMKVECILSSDGGKTWRDR